MASTGPQPASPVELVDVLSSIGLKAMDTFVSCLAANDSLAAVRLACRGLRDAIDCSVRQVQITIAPVDLVLGQPSLKRWSRCEFIELHVSATVPHADVSHNEDADALLVLPFSQLTAQQRAHIRGLACTVEAMSAVPTGPVATLAAGLPNLRELWLHGLQLACDPPQLSQLYNALASLRHLEALSLPSCAALAGISRLAGSERLYHLEVCEAVEGSSAASFGPQTLAELPQLRGLRRMAFVLCKLYDDGGEDGYDASLRFLLANPPPSLGSLEFLHCTDEQGFHVQFAASLRCGRLYTVEFPPSVPLPQFCRLARSVLLPSLAPGQRLEWLGLWMLDVALDDPSDDDEIRILQTVRQRCVNVELGALSLTCCAEGSAALEEQAQLAWRVQELLQSPPHRITVSFEAHTLSSAAQVPTSNCFGIQMGEPLPHHEAQPPLVHGVTPFSAPTIDAAAMLQTALQRLVTCQPQPPPLVTVTRGHQSWGQLQTGTPPATATAMPSPTDREPATLGLLLLHGPFVAALYCTPDVVRPWLDSLPWYWRHGVSSGPAGGGAQGYGSGQPAGRPCDGAGDGESFIRACQPLPSAGALLLAVEARGLQAVAAAARAAASRPGCAGWGFTLALEAAPLAGSWEDDPLGFAGALLRVDLFRLFDEELQGHWDEWLKRNDNPYGRTAAGRTQAALELVLSVRNQLTQLLPPMLVLD